MKKILLGVTIIAGLIVSASAGPLEFWTFDTEAAGVDLNDAALVNSGTMGSAWNFNTTGIKTDGLGNFVVAGDGGTTTRKLPKEGTANASATDHLYATAITGTDTYTFELNVSDWDLSAATIGDKFKLAAGSAAGISIERINETEVKAQLFAGNVSYRSSIFGLVEGAHTFAIKFNFATDTSEYLVDGSVINSFTDFGVANSVEDIAGMVLSTSGSWNTPGSSISIDSMGLSDSVIVNPPEGVYIAQQAEESAGKLAQTNTFASLSVTNGDYVVVGAAINKGTWNETNAISFAGSAALGSVVFESASGSGPNTHFWSAPVTSTGTVDVTMTLTEADDTLVYGSVNAYVVRSASGVVNILGTASAGSTTNAPSGSIYTNIYDFGTSTTGLFVEAASSYMDDDNGINSANPDYVVDQQDGVQRKVGHAEFSGVSSITNIWSGTTNRQAVVLGIAFAAGDAAPGVTPTSQYEDFLAGGVDVGSTNGLQDDADNDLLDNLTEYAFGGDAGDPANQGNTPILSQVNDAGTNYLEYIYFERDDAADRGLTSILEVGPDLLVNTNWTTAGIEVVGSGPSSEAGYIAVTNRIPMDNATEFLNLRIQFTP